MFVEVSIILGAAIAAAAGFLHFYDRFSQRGFYQQTRSFAKASSEAIRDVLVELRDEVRSARQSAQESTVAALASMPSMPDLSALPAQIEAAVAGGIVKASAEVLAAQAEPIGTANPAIQAMGVDAASQKALTRSLKAAIGTDMLGPYGSILSEWAPNVHAWLTEHPESVQWALSQPWVQSIINRAAMLVKERGGAVPSQENPFLKQMLG